MPNTTEPNQRKIESYYKYMFNHILDHMCICISKDCVCRGSIIQDAICEIRDLTKDQYVIRGLDEALENTR